MAEYTKEYKVAAGWLKFKITYNSGFGSLNFDVVNIADLEYGYEDDDQLTFYPNVFRLEFTDFERNNYEILKLSLNTYNPPSIYYETIGKVEVILNRGLGDELLYEGYIEPETLSYAEETRITSFDAVDKILQLKNISIPFFGDPTEWHNVPSILYELYKRVFPGLQYNITSDPVVFSSSSFNGIYFDHNWKFQTYAAVNGATVIWKDAPEQIYFQFGHKFWGNNYYPYNTAADLLRQFALEFGAMIGSPLKNKVYFKKRFIKRDTVNTINITDKILGKSFQKLIALKKIQAVINSNQFTGQKIVEGSYVANPNRGIPDNLYEVLEMNTNLACLEAPDPGSNVSIFVDDPEYPVYAVVQKDITDVDLDDNKYTIQQLITRYTYLSRVNARDKFEMTLSGIDYNIFTHYSLTFPGIPSYVLRPLTIKKNLLNNTTQMTALEVGL
ncbi:MAG: hypothetical protein KBG21_02825 [Ignavibacteria bacterium]|nr:hypothetical protein [Ignavibacteria bacterium]